MPYRLAADAVLLLHLAFIAFVMLGALLALRWHWMALIHIPAAAWGFFIELTGGICPLTAFENDFRRLAGASGYTDSFVEHYLLKVIYPDGLTSAMQVALAMAILAVNGVLYGWLVHRLRRRPVTHAA